MANKREEFLGRIRSRVEGYRPTLAPDVAWTPGEEPGRAEEIEDPPARFVQELEALGGHGYRTGSLEEARELVVSLVREREARLLVRWNDELLERLSADGPLREAGVEVEVWRKFEDFREVSGRAEVGLSTAEGAIAETGSLILSAGPGRGRTVTLLPPTYIVVIPAAKLLRTVPEAVRELARRGRLPNNFCFHTGPSRSGDIEMSLTIGVHGPGDVHVILVEEADE
jgi:L-lactate dehydrogenase complex protein LldG